MIATFIDELRGLGAGVRWTRGANLHLTMRFLGDRVPATTIPMLAAALDKIASITEPFPLVARGTGAFPDLARPRVIWIGLGGEPLIRLADRVESAVRDCGFPPGDRPFVPHLTIGRVRDRRGWVGIRDALAIAADRNFGCSLIDSMILYRSILGRESSTYEAIAHFAFSARA